MKTWMRAGLLVTAMGVAGPAAAESGNKFAKVENGVGNCIFSKKVLEADGEASYKVESDFKEGDEVHMRCYYGRLGDLAQSVGKNQNSLRHGFASSAGSDGHYWASLVWKDDKRVSFDQKFNFTSEDNDRTSGRFDLVPGGKVPDDCDWDMGKNESPLRCAELATFTKSVKDTHAKDQSKPFTTKICLNLWISYSDRTVTENLVEKDVVENMTFATGCFNYTVK